MSTENNRSVLAALRTRQGVPTVLVVITGVAASFAVFFAAYAWELRSVDENFQSFAHDRFQATESLFGESAKLVGFMDNIFLIGPKATSPGFTGYVRSLQEFFEADLSKQLSMHGITWAPRVSQAERSAYERTAQEVFDPKFRIHEPNVAAGKDTGKKREDCYPCFLSIGKTLLQEHPGEDLAADPASWKAMQQARDSGEAVASAPVEVSGDSKNRRVYRVFQPLYAGSAKMTVEQRREACTGFMCLDLDIGVMIDNALRNVKQVGINLWVYDTEGNDRVVVSEHASRLQASAANAKSQDDSREPKSTSPAKFFGRTLLLECRATDAFWAKRTIWQPWVLLCIGLAFTLALAFHQLSVTMRTSMIEQVVSTRLAAIQREVAMQQSARPRSGN